MAVVPAAHPLARRPGGGVALADLAAQPFVLATGGCSVNAGSVAEQAGLALWRRARHGHGMVQRLALVRGAGRDPAPELTLPKTGADCGCCR